MSKNNAIRKSDKKFIRTEKSRIRRQFSDSKKQEELINELYKKFVKQQKVAEVVKEPKAEVKPEAKKVVEKPAKKVASKKAAAK